MDQIAKASGSGNFDVSSINEYLKRNFPLIKPFSEQELNQESGQQLSISLIQKFQEIQFEVGKFLKVQQTNNLISITNEFNAILMNIFPNMAPIKNPQ